ncbi:hypothetical protein RMSM_02787 [Rhodopirellula maiorica SM1]|uniref:Uncharacterized protein n=1 Tax=Rhodopirellula maiorica SM1 TaxID=1265738 RepID=M5RLV1_9BACT|nr:hypothetical protein RMSM_02787 [Rhodopirellula maiorica SM1]
MFASNPFEAIDWRIALTLTGRISYARGGGNSSKENIMAKVACPTRGARSTVGGEFFIRLSKPT